uniref:Uncharacterized protein n=1 Tax=Octopus bimaculoides TaxID=37653 RepID=A0A0L8H7N5_OCTBM
MFECSYLAREKLYRYICIFLTIFSGLEGDKNVQVYIKYKFYASTRRKPCWDAANEKS